MARIRTIKPDFWTDEKLTECSMSARLLFIGMFNFADDNGNLPASAKKLKMQIFPADSIDCQPFLDELIAHGVLIEYSVNGNNYWNIKGFKKHQKINRPSQSAIPEPLISDDSLNAHGDVTDGMEGNGRDMDKEPPNPLAGGIPADSENPASTADPKPKRERKAPVQLNTFLDHCQESGEKPISEYQPLLSYVEDTGLPMEYVQLCWDVFKRDFLQTNPGRKQADWRRHFLNYVTKRYYKLWYVKDDGTFDLTSTGRQEKMFFDNRRAA